MKGEAVSDVSVDNFAWVGSIKRNISSSCSDVQYIRLYVVDPEYAHYFNKEQSRTMAYASDSEYLSSIYRLMIKTY